MKKIKLEISEALKFSLGILIALFSITGCSEMPYIGAVLTDHEVDRYLVSTDGRAVCFQDDLNSTCIRLTPDAGNGVSVIDGPGIHIYPQRRVYVFYHEGNPILRAERATITPTLTGANGDSGNNNNGNNGGSGNNNNGDSGNNNNGNNGDSENNNNGNNGDSGNNDEGGGNDNNGNNGDDENNNDNDNDNDGNLNDGHGWIIWVYYPDGINPETPPTLSESGVAVTINGAQLTDSDITGFAQFIGTNGEKGIQFFYPTESAELLDLKVRLEGVVDVDETAKFNINYLWKSQQ